MRKSAAVSPIDAGRFRAALGQFATGVTVVTVVRNGEPHGMTANAFMSVSLDPPLVVVSVDRRARLHALLEGDDAAGLSYGVSVLAEAQEAFSRHFGGRPQVGLSVPFVWRQGLPLIDGAVAHLVARVVDAHTAGDHTLYVAEVEFLDQHDGRPLLFHRGRYCQLDLAPLDDPLDDPSAHASWLGW